MKPGDVCEVEIDRIGILRNPDTNEGAPAGEADNHKGREHRKLCKETT
jgi:hypothetical protein